MSATSGKVPGGKQAKMNTTYLVNSANTLSMLANQFKQAHLNGDNSQAMELIKIMETSIKLMKVELEDRMAVKL